MRWLYKIAVVALVAAMMGCGGDAGDRAVLRFLGFDNPDNGQPDTVNQTSAAVDIFPGLCSDGSYEPFTETEAVATFINNSGSDIQLDTITVAIPDSGVATITQHVSQTITGGRCGGSGGKRCAIDEECAVGTAPGTCTHQESQVTFKLFDIETKLLVSAGVYNVSVTFSGEDLSAERFTVREGLRVTFANFDGCSSGGQ
ncbi:MAG: hypothetical protein HY699_15075 [Deltaproteobacteria bacterium]|nr:hypothetical protein [Deltaproteobacteria bacterium]